MYNRRDRVIIVDSLCPDTKHLIGGRGTVVAVIDGKWDGIAIIVDGEFRPTLWAPEELRRDDGEYDRIGEALTSGSKNAGKLLDELNIK